MKLINCLHRLAKKFSTRHKHPETGDFEALSLEFKAHFHGFKLLLRANNKALDNMGHIEKALISGDPFNMQFVRGKCTAIAVDVYRMIRNLEELTQGKYKGLDSRFKDIQSKISQILKPKLPVVGVTLILPFEAINQNSSGLTGNKMSRLAEIKNNLGLDVPDGFVITAASYLLFIDSNNLQTEIDRRFQTTDFDDLNSLQHTSEEIQKLIEEAPLPLELVEAIQGELNRLKNRFGHAVRIALRSSALGEDLAKTSFAGLYYSELNVTLDSALQAYRRVLSSNFSLPAITYRYNFGIKDEENIMCVGCLTMVDAECGGVIYSRNPLDTRDDAIFISSNWGLPKSVVDGNTACDQFVVSREPSLVILDQKIATKSTIVINDSKAGIIDFNPDYELQRKPSLNPSQVLMVAQIAIRLESHFGCPQDIEWAIEKSGRIVLLQSRPLQQIEKETTGFESAGKILSGADVILSGGTVINAGSACGPAFLVKKRSDLLIFPKGAILVLQQANPRWASLLSRAIAVITEEGSFAGHLANVAREFDIPALFGLQQASSIIKSGDIITIDTVGKTVYRGEVLSVLTVQKPRKNLIADSPVYSTLKDISRLIVPLHLLDPDSTDFNPSNCQTLHDITRFIHEKSVLEIFNFGKEHHFAERSAKQLVYKVPMQWWVLNLDDGFNKEIPGKRIYLEDINSIPMLAIWDGMIAVPWAGPPIDGRGFMAVMFQGSANRTIGDRSRTRTADKNYFIISKNFCSLSSKLGFHFSTIESMVSERVEENFISFMFKGGAADYQRRSKRVQFIGDILEDYGFNVTLKEDVLLARLESRSASSTVDCLKILGYLTIHSRQLDMIMSNGKSVNYYREKINRDITKVILNNNESV
ncbi:pyruvate, water dikinase [bacterium]|nr:pyruvate, water dikinase [bacterium]